MNNIHNYIETLLETRTYSSLHCHFVEWRVSACSLNERCRHSASFIQWKWMTDAARVSAMEMWCWRRMLRILWTARVTILTNEEVGLLSQKGLHVSLDAMIRKHKLTYAYPTSGMWREVMSWRRLSGSEWGGRKGGVGGAEQEVGADPGSGG